MGRGTSLQVGVVGMGFIGPAHVEALRRLGIAVRGIADCTPERAAERAEELGIELAYNSYADMLADAEIAVVHVASPNYLHFPQARAALEAGKHVICEKPLALSSAESGELLALAQRTGLVHAVNFNIRFYPLVQQARAMARKGELGQLFIVHGSYLQDWLLLPTDWSWRLEPELGGEPRAVGDIGSHWLDLLTFITGREIQAVCADFETFIPTRLKPAGPVETFAARPADHGMYVEQAVRTEDYATVALRFEGGARGSLVVSQVSAGRKNRLYFEIDGASAALAWDSERPNELWIGYRTRPNELLLKDPSLMDAEARDLASYPGGHTEGYPDTFKQLYRAVYRHIAEGSPAGPGDYPTFGDGHRAVRLAEAIQQSARQGRWVSLQQP